MQDQIDSTPASTRRTTENRDDLSVPVVDVDACLMDISVLARRAADARNPKERGESIVVLIRQIEWLDLINRQIEVI